MSLKLVFNNEIHRVSKLPVSITALINLSSVLFNGTLPSTWGLQYLDSEGDKVVLKTEEDFQALLAEAAQTNKTIKVYITSDGSFEQIDESETDYQIIQKEDPMEKNLPIEQPVMSAQPQNQPNNVLNTNGDKVEVVPERMKPWLKYCNEPKYQALKLFKRIRDESTPGDEKVNLLNEFEAKKAELNEDDKKWVEEKCEKIISGKSHHGFFGFFGHGPHGHGHHGKGFGGFRAMKLLKHMYDEETPQEEKAELEKKFNEVYEQLPEEQKKFVEEKREKFAAKAKKREKDSKKLKIVDSLSDFLKSNFKNFKEIMGDEWKKGRPHCREMKELVQELCSTFSALPEEKQAEVSTLLNGLPERFITCMKSKQERKEQKKKEKEERKLREKEEKSLLKGTPVEEEKNESGEKEKKCWKEKGEKCWRKEKCWGKDKCEKKEKFEKREKKSKSPKEKSAEKKGIVQQATETIKEGVATATQAVQDAVVAAKEALTKKKYAPGVIAKANQIREVFPDADADQMNEFVKNHYNLTTEQLINEFLLTSSIKN